MADAAWTINHGLEYPYDNDCEIEGAKPVADWAHAAARGILADLTDRRGVKHELNNIDTDVRVELVETLADIIREAHGRREEWDTDPEDTSDPRSTEELVALCEANGVRIVEAQEEEIRGMWDWLDNHGNACDCSFDTQREAALDAVGALDIRGDWKP